MPSALQRQIAMILQNIGDRNHFLPTVEVEYSLKYYTSIFNKMEIQNMTNQKIFDRTSIKRRIRKYIQNWTDLRENVRKKYCNNFIYILNLFTNFSYIKISEIRV